MVETPSEYTVVGWFREARELPRNAPPTPQPPPTNAQHRTSATAPLRLFFSFLGVCAIWGICCSGS